MYRFASIGLTAVALVVQICCAPPLRAAAFEAAEPMHCPIQKQECDSTETARCSGGPQLLSELPVKFIAPAQLQPGAVIADVPVVHAEEPIVAGRWSVPARTIPLRI